MEVLPGDLENATSQIDIACVSNGAYIFTVYDESGKCCGDNKGYYAVKVNGEEVVRGRSYFTSPNAYIIRTDYQAPTAQTKVQWLNKHNEARESFHTEKDVPFAPLVWSDSLAEAAAKRANDIAPTCGSGSATMDPWGEASKSGRPAASDWEYRHRSSFGDNENRSRPQSSDGR